MNRPLDERWEAKAIAAMDRFRDTDPRGWAAYLAEADEWDAAAMPITDGWDEQAVPHWRR